MTTLAGPPREDWHVHSTFSDGRGELSDNVRRAEGLGLTEICLVDHVRRDTSWVPSFVAEVARVRQGRDAVVRCSIEAKVLDRSGRLDLPPGVAGLAGLDLVHIADHRFPLPSGPADSAEVRQTLETGAARPEDLISCMVEALERSMRRVPRPLLAHLFSILPKVGLDESAVPDDALASLATAAAGAGAIVEVNEKWRCPSPRTLRAFAGAGVRIVASSDAHQPEAIGTYGYVARTFDALAVTAPTPATHGT